ncbi:MAG: hypothetical protein QG610_2377 [Euryarchaeota archaeon]|nr:hypothetical protein [Euryarchaeota archaeon]
MVSCSKNRILSLFLTLLLLFQITGVASSAGDITPASTFTTSANSSTENDLYTELSAQMELYNDNFDNVPMLVQRLVGSEEIAAKIELNDGDMLYVTIRMAGGKVNDFYSYDTPNDPNSKIGPTITVESDEETVREILESDDQLRKAVESMNEGSLNVEIEGFFRKTVLWSIQQLYS